MVRGTGKTRFIPQFAVLPRKPGASLNSLNIHIEQLGYATAGDLRGTYVYHAAQTPMKTRAGEDPFYYFPYLVYPRHNWSDDIDDWGTLDELFTLEEYKMCWAPSEIIPYVDPVFFGSAARESREYKASPRWSVLKPRHYPLKPREWSLIRNSTVESPRLIRLATVTSLQYLVEDLEITHTSAPRPKWKHGIRYLTQIPLTTLWEALIARGLELRIFQQRGVLVPNYSQTPDASNMVNEEALTRLLEQHTTTGFPKIIKQHQQMTLKRVWKLCSDLELSLAVIPKGLHVESHLDVEDPWKYFDFSTQ
ncbi:MAG: hypothetical protein WBA28_08750 [Microbacteriaceae bacterium]